MEARNACLLQRLQSYPESNEKGFEITGKKS
jgi:hypothetical protein